MKTAVLFGAGQVGAMLLRLVGGGYRIAAFADNAPGKWGTKLLGVPILSPKAALAKKPDAVFLCVTDDRRAGEMTAQLKELGYSGEIRTAAGLKIFDARAAVTRLLAEQINRIPIPGAVAELGVYRGEFAAIISEAFPDRPFHLFDTFEGFANGDVQVERERGFSRAASRDFSDTSVELAARRIFHPERAVFHRGWFPDTFSGCEAESFAFVSIDADLYQPTAAALPLFWERLSPGGVLMLHDVNSTQFTGVSRAVEEFCAEKNILPMPVCDLHGSAVLRKNP